MALNRVCANVAIVIFPVSSASVRLYAVVAAVRMAMSAVCALVSVLVVMVAML